MAKCSFCGREESPFKGLSYIKNTGVVLYFCSGKCRKNALKLGRDRRNVRWTESYRAKRAKVRAAS